MNAMKKQTAAPSRHARNPTSLGRAALASAKIEWVGADGPFPATQSKIGLFLIGGLVAAEWDVAGDGRVEPAERIRAGRRGRRLRGIGIATSPSELAQIGPKALLVRH